MAHCMPETYIAKRDFSKADWDDTALIEAYDKAMGALKEKLCGRKGSQHSQSKKDKKNKPKWKIGDPCRAVFTDDHLPYEAEILEIHEDDDLCLIRFIGYNNEQLTALESLLPSKGKSARARQIAFAKKLADQHWEVGDMCLALYSEDGLYYQAEIVELYPDDGSCFVKFLGYENEEEVALDDLLPLEDDTDKLMRSSSHSKERHHSSVDETSSTFSSEPSSENVKGGSHRRPTSRCSSQSNRCQTRRQGRYSSSHGRLPYYPPGDPMAVPFNLEMQDELGPVLMAWYMAGFHTGYYQGRSSRLMGRCNVQSAPSLRHLR